MHKGLNYKGERNLSQHVFFKPYSDISFKAVFMIRLQPRKGHCAGKTQGRASEGWTFTVAQSLQREALAKLL